MGTHDRDYTRQARQGMSSRLTPVTKCLLIVNVVICVLDLFILDKVPSDIGLIGQLTAWGAFTIQSAVYGGEIWQFLTFQFLHASVGHILANGIGLFIFGPWMERWWGSARFLIFYLLSGVAGAAFYLLLIATHVLDDPLETYLVGASAGIYGILIGVAVIAPSLRVRLLFPPVEMSMRQMALLVLGLAVASVIFNFDKNAGGQAGHLGGAILGFILVKFPVLLGGSPSKGKTLRPPRIPREPKLRPRTHLDLQASSEVDRILDKVSKEGLHSLTDEERTVLRKAAEDSDS